MSHSPLAVLLGLAGQSVALPEPSACWRRDTVPSPETVNTQGSGFCTSHEEVPRHGRGPPALQAPMSHLGALCQ